MYGISNQRHCNKGNYVKYNYRELKWVKSQGLQWIPENTNACLEPFQNRLSSYEDHGHAIQGELVCDFGAGTIRSWHHKWVCSKMKGSLLLLDACAWTFTGVIYPRKMQHSLKAAGMCRPLYYLVSLTLYVQHLLIKVICLAASDF